MKLVLSRKTFALAVALISLAACGLEPGGAPDDELGAIVEDETKADETGGRFSPTYWGWVPYWGNPMYVLIKDRARRAYLSFEVWGDVELTLETKFRREVDGSRNRGNRNLDTVVSLYREPTNGRWGRPLGEDDDSGWKKYSKLNIQVGAGKYRVLVDKKTTTGERFFNLVVMCKGAGCTQPTEPRDPPPSCATTTDLTCLVKNAVDPADGADLRLARAVRLSSLPVAVRREVDRASMEIENRSFDDSDYSASVEGIYGVFASVTDHSIVAYVVYGTGTGEPDYSDGIVIGIDLAGRRIYEESTDW